MATPEQPEEPEEPQPKKRGQYRKRSQRSLAEIILNNSQEHLDHLGPGGLSNRFTAVRIARGLRYRTGVPWNVTLMMEGKVPGGFYLEPHPSRLRSGAISPEDWATLENLLDVVPRLGACRYYILPDEAEIVLHILEISGPPRGSQRFWKQKARR